MVDTWSTLGELRIPRGAHSATPLQDGRILIAGGQIARPDEQGDHDPHAPRSDATAVSTTTVEFVDPTSATVQSGPSLLQPRAGHYGARLTDGRVVLVGGLRISAELQEVSGSETWCPTATTWEPSVPGPAPSLGDSFVELAPGRLMRTGGLRVNDTTSTDCWIWKEQTVTWQPQQPLNASRYLHGSATLADGSVLVVGGLHLAKPEGSSEALCVVERWSPRTGRWTVLGSLPVPVAEPVVTPLRDGNALITGGYDEQSHPTCSLYDATTNTLRRTGDLNIPRTGHTATQLEDGSVLVLGGTSNLEGNRLEVALEDAERWDPSTDAWTVAEGPGAARFAHTTTRLPDRRLLVVGGRNRGQRVGAIEVFSDPM